MMGDRDFRTIIQTALGSIGKELQLDIDSKNIQTIHLQEVVQCLRRSYVDRIDPVEIGRRGFNELLSGLLRKLEYGSDPKEFEIDDIRLKGQTDMLVDDVIMLFRPAQNELDNPLANDILYLMHVYGYTIKQKELLFILLEIEKKRHFRYHEIIKCLRKWLEEFEC